MPQLRRVFFRPEWLGLPALLLLAVVFGVPMILLFLASLNAPDFSLANYSAFFTQPANVRVLLQTIEVSVISTFICLCVGYPVAYFVAGASRRARMALLILVVIPYLTSLLARTYAWIVILGDRGLINTALLDLGLISQPLELIYNRQAVYIGMVHILLPVMILPLVSVMMGIDRSLVDAARSMGARPWTAFLRVFLPLSVPGARSGCLLVFVLCLGFYITPASLGGLSDTMLSTFIAAQTSNSFNLGRTAAAAFILLAIAGAVLALVGLDLSGQRPSAEVRPGALRRLLRALRAAASAQARDMLAPLRARRWKAELYKPSGRAPRIRAAIGNIFVGAVLAFLLFPGTVVIVMSFSAGSYLEFPPSSLSLRWYRSFFLDPSWTTAMMTSLQIGLAVVAVSTVVGTLAAYGLSRTGTRLRGFLMLLLLTPITAPVIVVGIATYFGLAEMQLIGSRAGIIMAHSIGATGFVIVVVAATLSTFDTRLELAAMSMRAGPLKTFTRVTLPLIRPGIIGGAVFAFIHSFDEVVISSLISGMSLRTLPLKMWENMRHQLDPTIAAVSSLLVLLPLLWLAAIYVGWWRGRMKEAKPA